MQSPRPRSCSRDTNCGMELCPNLAANAIQLSRGDATLDTGSTQHCDVSCTVKIQRVFNYTNPISSFAAPLFIFQWLFDEAQIRADSVGAPVTPQQWDFIHQMGGALRRSLENVTAVFAPSCIGHSVLDKREWMNIKIDDISLPDAIRCWEISTENQQRRFGGRRDRKSMTKEERELRRQLNKERQKRKRQQQGLSEGESPNGPGNKKRGHNKRKKNNNNHHKKELLLVTAHLGEADTQNQEQNNTQTSNNIAVFKQDELNARKHKQNRRNQGSKDRERKRENKRNRANQRRKNEVNKVGGGAGAKPGGHQHRHKNQRLSPRTDPKKCSLRLLEKCSWPQCNHSCPSLTNPVTGEEMRFLELLASFGLDIDAVATALGIDMQTLKNMDHAELVNLLTQQVS